jgi:NAD(P)-dependent dehydrogenase (short-subunit alcohol dehydrogenase family)
MAAWSPMGFRDGRATPGGTGLARSLATRGRRAPSIELALVGTVPTYRLRRHVAVASGERCMDLKLRDKVAVVTGASKGIGLSVVRGLLAEGAHVVAGARSVESLRELERVTPVAVDLSSRDGPARLLEEALAKHGRVDVLVNNVGAVRLRLEGFLGTSDDEFEWAMQVNFFSTLRATRAAIVPMLEQGGGAIVNVASVNAFFQPDAGTIDYGAAKAAVVNLTKALAQEFGSRGIRVNAVSPGPVSTDLWLGKGGVAATVAKATGVDPDTAREKVLASIGGIATGRLSTADEVANLVLFLASEQAANVTGSNYVIDGGLIKTT